MRRKRPSDETLVALRQRLEPLPLRSAERRHLVENCADLHGISVDTVYRALRDQFRPRALHRRDRGAPRRASRREMERWCELIAALKLRTTNLKGRHLSTGRAIELLVEHGVETPDGLEQAPPDRASRKPVVFLPAVSCNEREQRPDDCDHSCNPSGQSCNESGQTPRSVFAQVADARLCG